MEAVVHIGFHKTGSTALQRDFFPRLPDCILLTHGGRLGTSVFRCLSENLLRADDPDFLEDTIRSFFRETMAGRPSLLLVSHEGFSGDIYQGSRNRARNAVRLHAVLPQAKILMFVRQQADMLRSVYTHHIRRGGHADFVGFVTSTAPDADFDIDHLRYDTLVELYHELFGPDRVLVLAYESLRTRSAETLSQMLSFLQPDPHASKPDLEMRVVGRSLSPLSRMIVRRSNRLFVPSSLNPQPSLLALPWAGRLAGFMQRVVDPVVFPNAGIHLSPDDESFLRGLIPRYEQSNARLQQATGLRLGPLGYPLPGNSE